MYLNCYYLLNIMGILNIFTVLCAKSLKRMCNYFWPFIGLPKIPYMGYLRFLEKFDFFKSEKVS